MTAVLSTALAIGACVSIFGIADALLLRPLPVSHPDRLYVLSRESTDVEGRPDRYDTWAYPAFRLLRVTVAPDADLLAVSYATRTDVTYGADADMETASVQFVSGWMFESLGVGPAVGRVLTQDDDLTPDARPVAVLSHEYWTRRFGRDPGVTGRTFRIGDDRYTIVGVSDAPFVGIEPGTTTDVFLPTMMRGAAISRPDATWFRIIVRLMPGRVVEPVRARLDAASRAFEAERLKTAPGLSPADIERHVNQRMLMTPATAGVSRLQDQYQQALIALGVLVGLVLFIACVNVANLLTAQASARRREIAVRMSIGAGRSRLIQGVLMEAGLLAGMASALGVAFAWWAAPMVIRYVNPPDNPAQLDLHLDWRVLGFASLLATGVTLAFGFLAAIQVSSLDPLRALKGGEDLQNRRQRMRALIAVQVAFCFLVLMAAGLLTRTFETLATQPTGFSAARLLTLETVASPAQPVAAWSALEARVRSLPGVDTAALAGWPLLSGGQQNNQISTNGRPSNGVPAFFLAVSPGWLDAMKIPLLGGRDFRSNDVNPGAAIVNQQFVNVFLDGQDPIGRRFQRTTGGDPSPIEVVGVVPNARYLDVRETTKAIAYMPFNRLTATGTPVADGQATLIVRTVTTDPLALGPLLRSEVARSVTDFRVSTIRTQQEIDSAQMLRERLLAALAVFFSGVALLLAALGLYGVLTNTVERRRREIGIRLALGAQAIRVAGGLGASVLSTVLIGQLLGLGLGLELLRALGALLYGVRVIDLPTIAVASTVLLVAAVLVMLPSLVGVTRINPVTTLRE